MVQPSKQETPVSSHVTTQDTTRRSPVGRSSAARPRSRSPSPDTDPRRCRRAVRPTAPEWPAEVQGGLAPITAPGRVERRRGTTRHPPGRRPSAARSRETRPSAGRSREAVARRRTRRGVPSRWAGKPSRAAARHASTPGPVPEGLARRLRPRALRGGSPRGAPPDDISSSSNARRRATPTPAHRTRRTADPAGVTDGPRTTLTSHTTRAKRAPTDV